MKIPSAGPVFGNMGRFEMFTDGVFAIMSTLLILEVHVPQLVFNSTRQKQYINYSKSFRSSWLSFSAFFVVAIFWMNHHLYFTLLSKIDWKLMWLNIFFLFWLCFIHFTTDFIGDNPFNPVAISVYALVMAMASFAFTLMGAYTFKYNTYLLKFVPPLKYRRKQLRRGMLGTTIYFASAGLAFLHPVTALGILILMPFAYIIPQIFNKE